MVLQLTMVNLFDLVMSKKNGHPQWMAVKKIVFKA